MNRRNWIIALVAGIAAFFLLCGGGAVWVLFQLADQIGAPGPAATGSGPCGSGDSVNLRLVFADGRVSQACTKDRPNCAAGSMGTGLGDVFAFGNQLRSESGKYIFVVRFDVPVSADSAEQTVMIDPSVMQKPGAEAEGNPSAPRALVEITPRSNGTIYNAASGTVTVSSQHHVVHGVIDAAFTNGPPRTDRPQSGGPPQLLTMSGTFTCNA